MFAIRVNLQSNLAKIVALGVSLFMLPGCNVGDAAGEAIAHSIIEGFECGIRHCTESNTLSSGDISLRFVVTQNGDVVHVEGGLMKRANLFVTVQPSSGDSLSASIGNQTVQLVDISGGNRFTYAGNLRDSELQPTVALIYQHDGVVYNSTVTFVPRISMLAPSGPLTVNLAGSGFAVQLSMLDPTKLSASIAGNCARVDGTSANMANAQVPYQYVGVVTGGTAYHINPTDLDTALNTVSRQPSSSGTDLSLVQTCDLHISWAESESGQTSTGLANDSSFVAQTSVTNEIFYNGQH
jgi:hypothetical protein